MHPLSATNADNWKQASPPDNFWWKFLSRQGRFCQVYLVKAAEQTVEECHLTDTAQILQNCLCGESCGIHILGWWGNCNTWLLCMGNDCDRCLLCWINQKKLLTVVKDKCQVKLHQYVLLRHDHASTHIHYCHGCHSRMQVRTDHLLYFIACLTSTCSSLWKIHLLSRIHEWWNVICVKKTLG